LQLHSLFFFIMILVRIRSFLHLLAAINLCRGTCGILKVDFSLQTRFFSYAIVVNRIFDHMFKEYKSLTFLKTKWNRVIITQIPKRKECSNRNQKFEYNVQSKTETKSRLIITRQLVNPSIINIKIKTWFSGFHPPESNNLNAIKKLRQKFFLLMETTVITLTPNYQTVAGQVICINNLIFLEKS